MSLRLCVISGKGGTGKSTVSFGLAAAFCSLGKSVVIVDLDEGLRCIDTLAGIDDIVVNDLSDILEGGSADNAVYNAKYVDNLKIIPAPANTGVINYVNLSAFSKRLEGTADVIIFDFPAGIDQFKLKAAGENSVFLVVANMDGISLKDAAAIKERLPQTESEPRLIINRFNAEYIKDGVWSSIDSMINTANLRLCGESVTLPKIKKI